MTPATDDWAEAHAAWSADPGPDRPQVPADADVLAMLAESPVLNPWRPPTPEEERAMEEMFYTGDEPENVEE